MPRTLRVISEARRCDVCAPELPLGPRPLLAGSAHTRIVIIGQAPGRITHEAGTPWQDKSGERLREWLGLDEATFYDDQQIALMPMGFCYPGSGSSGDLPPRPECAPLWHPKLLKAMGSIAFTVLIGKYAFERYFIPEAGPTPSVTQAVARYAELLPDRIALPHPSPRNNRWLAKNPWFEADCLPLVKARVRSVLASALDER